MSEAAKANSLSVSRDNQNILHGISFVIQACKITGLIGPSGSGKTTLMRAIVGVQRYEGELEVLGQAAGSKKLRTRIGYVTQTPAVYGDLTVVQNLAYFAQIVGADSSTVHDVIKTVQLTKQANQRVDSLSGGQRARVSLAIALLGDPELLVLDEPTVGLDPILREELWALFAELVRRGKTLLISSHVMDEAERCDNLLLMRDGAVLWQGERDELLRETKTSDVGDAFIVKIKEAA